MKNISIFLLLLGPTQLCVLLFLPAKLSRSSERDFSANFTEIGGSDKKFSVSPMES